MRRLVASGAPTPSHPATPCPSSCACPPTPPEGHLDGPSLSRRSFLKALGAVAFDTVVAAGLVGGDYYLGYCVPRSLGGPVSGEAATSASASPASPPETSEASFAGSFATDGSVTSDDSSYRSANIAVGITRTSLDSGRLDHTSGGRHEKYGTGISYVLADASIASIDCLRTAFANDTYGIGFSEPLASMTSRLGAVLAVNGDSYSNHRHRQNGTIIRNGELYRAAPSTEETCVLFRDGSMRTYAPGELDARQAVADGAWQSWVFGPSLLDDKGRAKSSFLTWDYIRQSHPRTAIGYVDPGHHLFLVVDGRSRKTRGMFLSEMSQLFEQLGCRAAYNLDGGHSTSMILGSVTVDEPYSPDHPVSDAIYLAEPMA